MEFFSVKELQDKLENEISGQLSYMSGLSPVGLYEPIVYSLQIGGKRLRPIMVLLAFNLFSEKIEEALPAALAIEIFHNFTLLHDDLMDKAELRRNRPTVHIQFDQNKAILSGDAMSFISYQYLQKCKSQFILQVLDLFSSTAVEVCEGQQFDMDFEERDDVTESEYLEMIRLKTAVLLGCSLKTGTLLAGMQDKITNQLYDYGLNLGIAFQLQDDLLDTFGDSQIFGKKIGGDIVSNKKTYLLIKAIELANSGQMKRLKKWLGKTNFDAAEKIDEVTKIYNELNVNLHTQQMISLYFNKARSILDMTELNDLQKNQLISLSETMFSRNH